MSTEDLSALLYRLFPELGKPLEPSSALQTQGINSMGMIVLITHLQDEFGIVFDYDTLSKPHEFTFATLQALCSDGR
ncbi:phosphopantetheine-binding protein [Pseudomonas sp. KFB-139]|uniref:Phosphopantetheine-binding protein n=1 Tax=Pseudomonas serbiensis TaxID=3064350 RepID=A0ABT9CST6_9PSED|nr:phosphopantetheine-binding protein [Pseudomonas sp. KFB-138]MDO7926842.1 phosphopantetheine-binding protein [Pseudomonas sp. KFB-138]